MFIIQESLIGLVAGRLTEYRFSAVPIKGKLSVIFFLCLVMSCRKTGQPMFPDAGLLTYSTQSHHIEFTVPIDGATEIDTDSPISLKVSDPFNVSGYDANAILLRSEAGLISGKTVYTGKTVDFIPDTELLPFTTYQVIFNSTVQKSDSGSEFGSRESVDIAWTFTTGDYHQYNMELRSSAVTDFIRDGNKLMQMGDYIYSYGGWSGHYNRSYNDVYRSSGDLSVWEQVADAPWKGRHTYGIGKVDSTLFIFGGDFLSNLFDVWKSDDGENFVRVADSVENTIGSRILYGACVHNKKLFVLGGQKDTTQNVGLTDIWSSPDGAQWTKVDSGEGFLGQNISGSVASFNGRIWVVGGGYYDNPYPGIRWTNEVYSSYDGRAWTRQPEAPWSPRQFTDVCVYDNKLWMIGGHDGLNMSDIWYMRKNGEWINYPTPINFNARHASAIGVYNDKLVIACGNENNDCWVIERAF